MLSVRGDLSKTTPDQSSLLMLYWFTRPLSLLSCSFSYPHSSLSSLVANVVIVISHRRHCHCDHYCNCYRGSICLLLAISKRAVKIYLRRGGTGQEGRFSGYISFHFAETTSHPLLRLSHYSHLQIALEVHASTSNSCLFQVMFLLLCLLAFCTFKYQVLSDRIGWCFKVVGCCACAVAVGVAANEGMGPSACCRHSLIALLSSLR